MKQNLRPCHQRCKRSSRQVITFAVVGTVREMLILVGILVSMSIINLTLTGVALVVLVVLITIANFWRIFARKAYIRVRETNAIVNAELAEAFNGVRVTQAFARDGYNYHRFTSKIDYNNREANVAAARISGFFFL